MTSTYPAQIDNTYSLPTAIDNLTPVQGILFNNLRDAVIAIESAIGTQPAGPYSNVAARFTNLENIVGNLKIITLAGDLGGTLADPVVIGIQGVPVVPGTPNFGQVMMSNGIAWIPTTFSGDIAQISSTQGQLTVININGASVPVSGALITGNVLQVSGAAALSYGPVNLAGGSNYVSGVLPASNLPLATTSALGIIQLAGDIGNVATAPQVLSLTGAAGVINVANTGNVITWASSTTAPGLGQVTNAVSNGHTLTLTAQSSIAAASSGGAINLVTGVGTSNSGPINLTTSASGSPGRINFNIGGTTTAFLNATSFNLTNNANLTWVNTSATPSITQNITTTGTGQLLTIQAQNATGFVGGALTLTSGSGTTAGALNLQVGGTNAITISGTQAIVLAGSVAVRSVTETTDYVIDSGGIPDYVVQCNDAGPMNVTLPVPTRGRMLIIKDITGAAATNPITIIPNGSELIEGINAPYVLATNFGVIRLQADPSGNWWFV
jgi:hypothetical protein